MKLKRKMTKYVTHLYKTSHMSQKEEKMGFDLVQKIFIEVINAIKQESVI